VILHRHLSRQTVSVVRTRADVAQWFEKILRESLPDTSDSAFLQAFNDALEIRRLTAGLGKPQRQAVAAVLPKELATA
jgi:hypothetical protein